MNPKPGENRIYENLITVGKCLILTVSGTGTGLWDRLSDKEYAAEYLVRDLITDSGYVFRPRLLRQRLGQSSRSARRFG